MTEKADMKQCPYCAEEIRSEATRCRFCRSRLGSVIDNQSWHRSHGDARLAGVSGAVARSFAVPVTAVRLGFVVLTFFHLLGPLLYGILWLIVPDKPEGDSVVERLLRSGLELAGRAGGHGHRRRESGEASSKSVVPVND